MKKIIFTFLVSILCVCASAQTPGNFNYQKIVSNVADEATAKAYVDATLDKVLQNQANLVVKDADGNIYKTVKIGNQVWMAENLKTTKYADGKPIPLVKTTAAWDALTTTSKAYCWYNDSITYKNTYGALYTWAAAMNGAASRNTKPSGVQGVCPTGWHLPSEAEWKELIKYLGESKIAGGKMKETGTTHWASPNTGATNESGFSSVPGGYHCNDGSFDWITKYGIWWSSTEHLIANWVANYWFLDFSNATIVEGSNNKETGFSVRCIRNY